VLLPLAASCSSLVVSTLSLNSHSGPIAKMPYAFKIKSQPVSSARQLLAVPAAFVRPAAPPRLSIADSSTSAASPRSSYTPSRRELLLTRSPVIVDLRAVPADPFPRPPRPM
jgi:hypothetical protein